MFHQPMGPPVLRRHLHPTLLGSEWGPQRLCGFRVVQPVSSGGRRLGGAQWHADTVYNYVSGYERASGAVSPALKREREGGGFVAGAHEPEKQLLITS